MLMLEITGGSDEYVRRINGYAYEIYCLVIKLPVLIGT